jgi:hypothetical protein
MLPICTSVGAEGDAARVVVPVPANWREAARIRLVLEGATAPGNRPFKLRVTTTDADRREVFLGSTGVEALGPGEAQTRRLPELRLDITRALKAFLEKSRSTSMLELRIEPVDGRNQPLPELKITTGKLRMETRQE